MPIPSSILFSFCNIEKVDNLANFFFSNFTSSYTKNYKMSSLLTYYSQKLKTTQFSNYNKANQQTDINILTNLILIVNS